MLGHRSRSSMPATRTSIRLRASELSSRTLPEFLRSSCVMSIISLLVLCFSPLPPTRRGGPQDRCASRNPGPAPAEFGSGHATPWLRADWPARARAGPDNKRGCKGRLGRCGTKFWEIANNEQKDDDARAAPCAPWQTISRCSASRRAPLRRSRFDRWYDVVGRSRDLECFRLDAWQSSGILRSGRPPHSTASDHCTNEGFMWRDCEPRYARPTASCQKAAGTRG